MKSTLIMLLLLGIIFSVCQGARAQSLVGDVHTFVLGLADANGNFLGYEQSFCDGGLFNPGTTFEYDVFNGYTKVWYGHYSADWSGGPYFDTHYITDTVWVVEISGGLINGTWTPYIFVNGQWVLDQDAPLCRSGDFVGCKATGLNGWFHDHEAAANKPDPKPPLGCGGLEVIFAAN